MDTNRRRARGVFLQQTGLNQYSFREVGGELPLTVQWRGDPILRLVEYDLTLRRNETCDTVVYFNGLTRAPLEDVSNDLFQGCPPNPDESLIDFLERRRSCSARINPNLEYRVEEWIKAGKLCFLLQLFGLHHRAVFKYIRDQKLLSIPLQEWISSPAALRCPWHIHLKVLRASPDLSADLIDEIAYIQEMKHAMCRFGLCTLTDEHLMRAYDHCNNVEETVKRLVEKKIIVVKKEANMLLMTFADWSEEEVLVEPGQPLEPYVYRLRRWHCPNKWGGEEDTGPTYHRFGRYALSGQVKRRIQIPSTSLNDQFEDIKLLIQAAKARRVLFVVGYDAPETFFSLYGSYRFTDWQLMRTTADNEFVFLEHIEQTKCQVYEKGMFTKKRKSQAIPSHPNVLKSMYYYSQALDATEVPSEVIGWCDIVFFMSRRRTYKRWLSYYDRMCRNRSVLCVVGEMPEL